jgi:hypothetical protein
MCQSVSKGVRGMQGKEWPLAIYAVTLGSAHFNRASIKSAERCKLCM